MSTDRSLLFGILAVQLDFVTQDALTAALNAWRIDKARPLGEVLRERGDLSAGRLQLLDALVAEHLRQHGDDPKQSLAALSSIEDGLRQSLAQVPDTDVQQTLSYLAWPPGPGTLPYPPQAGAAGREPSGVRYRILRPHARGGLGEVYVAEDTEVGRNVALKEIQGRYADDDASRDRFVREAEITGGLEHPGIVPVYGLGTYSDGRPFYAMRFIQGDNLQEAIKRFHGVASGGRQPPETRKSQGANAPRSADFASLEFRDLLRRFIDVCNAVAYAHSRGVLHRDLKPGNVMLGQYGETLVVDWGLAKATGRAGSVSDRSDDATLHPRSGGDSSATVAGQALGTPAYMSPEQADGRLADLGPATDVYSLGATLYELLAGQVPFAARTVTELLDAVKAGRFPAPRAVQPAVPAALEAVCLKAMALAPADRYPSALALAREVERFLADEPVAAYPEPVGVRLRRWVRRHARLVTGIAAAFAVTAVGTGLLAWQRERARKAVELERAETARERDAAREQKRRTRAALDTMVSKEMVERLGTQKQLTAGQRAFLQTALGYYKEFAAEAATEEEGRKLEADAHFRVGYLLWSLGLREEAVAAYRAATAAREKLAVDYPAASHRRDLAGNHNNLGVALRDLGQRTEAEAAYRAALAVRERLAAEFPAVPDHRRDLAQSHNNLGWLLADLGKSAEAEAAYRAALAVMQRFADDHPASPDYRREMAQSHNNLGVLLADLGKTMEAETAYRAALAVQERLVADYPGVPEYRRELSGSHNNLCALYGLGKPAEAEAACRAALAVRERLAAEFPAVPDYRYDLAQSHSNLGVLLRYLRKPAEAETAYRAALVVQERLVADHPTVPDHRRELALSHNNLALLLADLGRRVEAEPAFRAALAQQERLAAEHPAIPSFRRELAVSHNNLGLLLADLGKRAEAESSHRAALALRQKLASDHPEVPTYFDDLADSVLALSALFVRAGRVADAVAMAGRAAGGPAPSAGRLYNCACIFALASAEANNPDADAHGARAVVLLRQAVARGYRDVSHMLGDADLAALRRRDDFAALLWELADGPPGSAPR